MTSIFRDITKMNDYFSFKSEKEKNKLIKRYPKNSISLFLKLSLNFFKEDDDMLPMFFIMVFSCAFMAFFPYFNIVGAILFLLIMGNIFLAAWLDLLKINYYSFINDIAMNKFSNEIISMDDLKEIKHYIKEDTFKNYMNHIAAGKNIYWATLINAYEKEIQNITKQNNLKKIQEDIL